MTEYLIPDSSLDFPEVDLSDFVEEPEPKPLKAGKPVKEPTLVDEVEPSGNYEQDVAATQQAVLSELNGAGYYKKKYADELDSEYWFAVVFTSRAEKEDFLRRHGLDGLGDKYLNGRHVAAALSQGE